MDAFAGEVRRDPNVICGETLGMAEDVLNDFIEEGTLIDHTSESLEYIDSAGFDLIVMDVDRRDEHASRADFFDVLSRVAVDLAGSVAQNTETWQN